MHASKFTKFKFIVRNARVFPGICFDFIDPHNSSLFFAAPHIYVAADKNKIYSPVLLSCFETNIYQRVFLRGRTHANKAVTDRQSKFVNKHFITVLSVTQKCLQIAPDRWQKHTTYEYKDYP